MGSPARSPARRAPGPYRSAARGRLRRAISGALSRGVPIDRRAVSDPGRPRPQYTHDGDEARHDCLTGTLHTETESSEPGALCFEIGGVNDRTPRLVNNTGVTVFAGGTAVVTTAQLGTSQLNNSVRHK